ncbi:MAG: hypothetical protein PUF12_12875 [Thermoflexaceae bacterium]|nr:hypothetical protein [Thermoflexaceae bacterium]
MKKRFLTALFTSMIILSTTILVFAEEKEYSISAINLILNVTDELNVLTRNVSEGNPALEILDADAIELQNSYLQNHVYLDAFPDNLQYEILVTATDVNNSQAKNFSELSEADFMDYCDKLTEQFASSEKESLLEMKIYENDTTKYVYTYTHSTFDDVSVYAAKYYTVMNGYNYNYTLQSNDLPIDGTLSTQLKDIVDSAQYTEVKSSITESGLFMELYETFIGFGITVLVLGVLLFLLIRSTKKVH